MDPQRQPIRPQLWMCFGKLMQEIAVVSIRDRAEGMLYVRLARVSRVGTNSLKISRYAPNIFIESATPKTPQSLPPIYLKKSAQNKYIGGRLFDF